MKDPLYEAMESARDIGKVDEKHVVIIQGSVANFDVSHSIIRKINKKQCVTLLGVFWISQNQERHERGARGFVLLPHPLLSKPK